LIKNNSVLTPDPVLMQLHQGGGIPFFAVAAPGVDSLGFALLSRNLGKEQSVYKLQSPGPPIWDRPFGKEELRALAHEYVTAMRTVQSHGPFCLGGMCDGVQIAQQMILELESEGEEVALFTIFDTWVLEHTQIRPLWAVDYYMQRIRTMSGLSLRNRFDAIRRGMRRWLGFDDPANNRWDDVYWPDEGFQPPSFQAPVLLFKRPRQPFYYVRDPQMGWGTRSTAGIEICEVDCGHVELLRPPYVQVVGQKLAERLKEISERQKKTSVGFSVVREVGFDPGFSALA
jgi:thioesterase domain-containing protein